MSDNNTQSTLYRYKAFISYRHLPVDRRWAKWLFESVETYHTPHSLQKLGYPKQLGKLFRDEEEIPASASLSRQIEEALHGSEYLIVVCSPETPKSRWICEEIRLFRELGRGDRILALLIDGEPSDSFPAPLLMLPDGTPCEPIAADVRSRGDLTIKEVKRSALLKIVAGLIDIKFDVLYQREERRRRRIVIIWMIGLSILTIGFAILGGTAYRNYLLAKQQKESLGVTLAAADFKEGVRLVQEGRILPAMAYLARAVRTNGDAASATLAASLLMSGRVPIRLEFLTNDTDNASLSPDERWLAVTSGSMARVLDVRTGQPISPPVQHKNTISTTQFSPDGHWLATASWDKTAQVWDVHTGKPISSPLPHDSEVESLVFSPDGRQLLTTAWDGTVRLWNIETSQSVFAPMQHDYSISCAQFSPDGHSILTVSGNNAQVWNAKTGELVSPPMKHEHTVHSASFSPDGYRVYTVSNGTVMGWDTRSGQLALPPVFFEDNADVAELSPDGRLVATISGKTARVWNAMTGHPFSPPIKHEEPVLSVQFSPDERWVLTTTKDKSIHIWDAETGLPVSTPLPHQYLIHTARFSPSGRWILTVSDRSVWIWHARTYPAVSTNSESQGTSNPSLFSPDKRRQVKISNNIAKVWEVQTNKAVSAPMMHTDYITSAQFSSDGHSVVTASWDKTARIWDAQTGQPVSQPMHHDKLLYSAQFSPDSRWVVTAAADGTARVWEAKTGLPVSVSMTYGNDVDSANFSPDGQWVTVGSKQWEFPILLQAGSDFADFIENIAGFHLVVSGGLEAIPSKARIDLYMLLTKDKNLSIDARRFLEWLFTDPVDRAISPHSTVPTGDHLRQLIDKASVESLNEALDTWAGYPLALAKLAETDSDDLRALHWARLVLRNRNNEDSTAHALAIRILAGFAQRGSMAGITVLESHHTPSQERYKGTLKEFDPKNISDTLRRALALMRGDEVVQDIQHGLTMLKQAAKTGDDFARYQLARAISYGAGSAKDEAAACREYLALAATGLPHVQNSLGWCYHYAKLTGQRNYAQARAWYDKAARQGYPAALSNLGDLYKDGEDVERDWIKARDYYRQAAEKGLGFGAFQLAEMIEQGLGGAANSTEALVWYQKAAELGDDSGMLTLASRYEAGANLPQSYEMAADWYRRAASKGNVIAQFKLGSLILEDKIHADETAAYWFSQAAEQGTQAGTLAMGMLFESGTGGVKRDTEQAKYYYKTTLQKTQYEDGDPIRAEAIKRLESLHSAPT